jgi:UDP-3-O-[3-hydroxymyristoyl] glucosamine N-acyltransferase
MGRHCLMVAQSGIAGSVTVGNYCVFAGQSGVVGHVRIGDGVRIGAKTGISKDVPAGQEMLGVPAIPIAAARRMLMSLPHLPELRSAVKKLLKEVGELKRRLAARGGDDATGGGGEGA